LQPGAEEGGREGRRFRSTDPTWVSVASPAPDFQIDEIALYPAWDDLKASSA
jgi:hypothetical protein